MLNLDTHILLDAIADDLAERERALLSSNQWGISAIVLWELAKLKQLGRIEIDLDSEDLAQMLSRLTVWPLDLAVARRSAGLDFRSDPADEIIAATSIVHRVPLLTRDRRIRTSKLVPLARV
jgi:PIN domain nuclease of toxin-antitoxin system